MAKCRLPYRDLTYTNQRGHCLQMKKKLVGRVAKSVERTIQPSDAGIMSMREAAKYLKISMSALYKLTSAKKITHYKPGGKMVYFLKADLDAYVLQNRVPSDTNIAGTIGKGISKSYKQKTIR
jgi:excisionase family DNA binding protein